VSEERNPLDSARDLLIYLPVGVVVTAVEELPRLVAKGRTRVDSQVAIARVVGQFAVQKGRQELDKRIKAANPPGGPTRGETSPPAAEADRAKIAREKPAAPPADRPDHEPIHHNGNAPTPTAGAEADSLAIPGYDSLAASQVVQRLAGLSDEELSAVGLYEQSHRARRTILNRVSQLQDR
jgi:hypothetical protein